MKNGSPRSGRKVLRLVAVLLGLWLCGLGGYIWWFGNTDRAERADCIIVLGAAVRNGVPSPVFAERIRHAALLYQQGLAGRIIFTGGLGEGDDIAEGTAGAAFARTLGIPVDAILTETVSRTTWENLEEAQRLMREHSLESSIIVSDPMHMRRSLWIAGRLKMKAHSSPTATSRYRSLGPCARFLLREIYLCHHFAVVGK